MPGKKRAVLKMPRRKNVPAFSDDIVTAAKEIHLGHDAKFSEAEDALQAAVEAKDFQTEQSWRTIFDAYRYLADSCELCLADECSYHNRCSAGAYSVGENPRHTPEEQAAYDAAMEGMQTRNATTSEYDDDDVPF